MDTFAQEDRVQQSGPSNSHECNKPCGPEFHGGFVVNLDRKQRRILRLLQVWFQVLANSPVCHSSVSECLRQQGVEGGLGFGGGGGLLCFEAT